MTASNSKIILMVLYCYGILDEITTQEIYDDLELKNI